MGDFVNRVFNSDALPPPAAASSNARPARTRYIYRCADCSSDGDGGAGPQIYDELQRAPVYCRMCGTVLAAVRETATAAATAAAGGSSDAEDDERAAAVPDSIRALFDLMGADFGEALAELIGNSTPSRSISVDYLKTLGKIVVEPRKSILRDIYLAVGPLRILAISASFGFLPSTSADIEGRVVVADPYTGNRPLLNESTIRSGSGGGGGECSCGCIVLMGRGDVSFAAKSNRAIAAGAKAVVVAQSLDIWPFMMTDSAGEFDPAANSTAAGGEGGVPVVMIGRKDAAVLQKMIEQHPQVGGVAYAGTGARPLRCTLRIGNAASECSICQDAFDVGAEVLKLPCRHLYHAECVTSWLQRNNTCPLCRLELPREEPSSAQEGPRRLPLSAVATTFYN